MFGLRVGYGILTTFLYIVLGAVIGIVMVPVLLWVFFKFLAKPLFRRWLKRLEKKLAEMGALYPPVPPFRVTLESCDEPEWPHPKVVDQATSDLEAIGYEAVGDYSIQEMYPLTLRAFANPQAGAYAVVYDFAGDSPGVVVDLVTQFHDKTGVTCSNAPIQGLDEPPWEEKHLVQKKIEEGAIADIAAKLEEVAAGRDKLSVAADRFVQVFQDAYGRKMDWQVNRGGLTADEIRRNLALVHGVDDADEVQDEVVEAVQSQWRSAIARFVSDKTRERFLRHVTKMSASQWEDIRDRLYIVHDRSVSEELIDELQDRLMDLEVDLEEDHEFDSRQGEIEEMLKPHFADCSPREGFEAAQAVLPASQRYKRIARITGPWPADVYVEPDELE